jgi:esterase/lipase
MIWDFQNVLSRRLIVWAGVSTLAGILLMTTGGPAWRAFGIQAAAWGIIDGIIGWFGLKRAQSRLGKPSTDQEEDAEGQKIRRILWINNALDVLYVAGGTAMVFFLGRESSFWRGTGWGIIIQGAFLFVFDLWHALRVPHPLHLPAAPLFTHPDHQPFLFTGEKPAALLVHGFPGTALEMRHIGRRLQENGWTVQGIRLPGFGVDLAEVIHYNNEIWVNSLQKQMQALRNSGHAPLMLVGFSFGGGLALQAAARETPDALVLIAPLIWQEPPWLKILADFIRGMLPVSVHPFHRISMNAPKLREEFHQYLPEMDLENPDHTGELIHLEIPLYILDQIREVGRQALKAASHVNMPTLLIQGTSDSVIRPERTRKLEKELGGPVTYTQVSGPHSLTMPHNPAFDRVLDEIGAFARTLLSEES